MRARYVVEVSIDVDAPQIPLGSAGAEVIPQAFAEGLRKFGDDFERGFALAAKHRSSGAALRVVVGEPRIVSGFGGNPA